jgi:hypothetical protein
MYGHLSLKQAPPFSVPARFFITAPIFGAIAALILLFTGADLWDSRWTPGMLAITHCLVLGFFGSIMIGAMQQLLPVVASTVIQRPRFVATLIHFQWLPGVALLVYAFMRPSPALFGLSVIFLSGAILSFVSIILYSLHQSESRSESVPGIKIAVASLFITLVMGITLALGYTNIIPLLRPSLTNLHLSWGLVGWIAVLIMSFAIQLVPMFQITNSYPLWVRRYVTPVILILLLLKIPLAWPGLSALWAHIDLALDVLIAACLFSFAVVTLKLQKQARRKIRDSHKDFWRLGMVNLMAVSLLSIISVFSNKPLFEIMTVTVFLFGFTMAIVTGMLLRIIAFLIWLHLSAANDALGTDANQAFQVPKMKAVISSKASDTILILLIVAELSLISAVIYPAHFTTLAALLWFCQFSLLAFVLGRAIYRYNRLASKIAMFSARTAA